MSELIVMVGLPGSGKSTVAEEIKADNLKYLRPTEVKIFSSDNYRKKMFGDENDQTHNEQVFNKLYSDLESYLTDGINVAIFDATNTTLKSRRKLFEIKNKVGKHGFNVIVKAVVVPTPINICIERDSKRERTVGAEVIKKFYMSFQMPQYFEGFSEIKIIGLDSIKYDFTVTNPLLSAMLNFDQKNPHHIYPLNIHCDKLAENYEIGSLENIAGKLHDLGKLFTQTFDENGIAHYYGHDSVGTYEVLSHLEYIPCLNVQNILYILFLINWHMRGHKDLRSPKAEKRYRNLFGSKWYDALIQFADYDILASGTSEQHNELKKIYG